PVFLTIPPPTPPPSPLSLHDALPISVLVQPDERLPAGVLVGPAVQTDPCDVDAPAVEPRRPLGTARGVDDRVPRAGELDPEVVEDRKSTRLNSSHDQISYAVFCLKKK